MGKGELRVNKVCMEADPSVKPALPAKGSDGGRNRRVSPGTRANESPTACGFSILQQQGVLVGRDAISIIESQITTLSGMRKCVYSIFTRMQATRVVKVRRKANFQMAEHMEYGHNTGCEFLTGKCMENGKTKWPNMFCDAPVSNEKAYVCTTDSFGLGGCAVTEDYMQNLPIQFRYFESPYKGGLEYTLTDYCPVVEQLYPHGCTNPNIQWNMPGSLFGTNSMCLDGNALQVKTESESVSVGAVCAEISCEGGSVRVKYHGDNNTWHKCPEGKTLTPSMTSKSFESGTIKCPKYKEVCNVAPDGSSLVAGATKHNDAIILVYDGSSVPFGLIPSMAFLVLSFAGYLIA